MYISYALKWRNCYLKKYKKFNWNPQISRNMNVKLFCILESNPLKWGKVIFLRNSPKKIIGDRIFLFRILKFTYHNSIIYSVLCQLVENWRIDSIGKNLNSGFKFRKNAKKWLFNKFTKIKLLKMLSFCLKIWNLHTNN